MARRPLPAARPLLPLLLACLLAGAAADVVLIGLSNRWGGRAGRGCAAAEAAAAAAAATTAAAAAVPPALQAVQCAARPQPGR